MIRKWLCRWLGISDLNWRLSQAETRCLAQIAQLTSLAADVSVYGESTIIIISRIGGGRVKIINAKFNGIHELTEFTRMCERNFGCRTTTIDAPRNDPRLRF